MEEIIFAPGSVPVAVVGQGVVGKMLPGFEPVSYPDGFLLERLLETES